MFGYKILISTRKLQATDCTDRDKVQFVCDFHERRCQDLMLDDGLNFWGTKLLNNSLSRFSFEERALVLAFIG